MGSHKLQYIKKVVGHATTLRYKWDSMTKSWKLKKRIIMDSNRSGVKAASKRQYKSVLPRVTDAVSSLLQALNDNTDGESTEQFVIDATDAFWELGLHPSERRYFVGKIGGSFYVYLRTAQGSRGAPLSWATVFGLICRCVQSLFYLASLSHTFPITTQKSANLIYHKSKQVWGLF